MDGNDMAALVQEYLPQIVLVIGGLLAILIAFSYHKDKESGKYKALMVLGVLFGVFMAFCAVSNYGTWGTAATIIIAIAAFALIIRPFRDVQFAVIFALLVMAIVYIWLGGLTIGNLDISIITDNPGRAIVSFLIGAIFYSIFHFAEAIVKLFGKVLNWWPLLFVLGVFCIIEAVLLLSGHSIEEFINF